MEQLSLTSQEERVVAIASWMLLRLEQSIKIPEGTLHVVVGRHLREPEHSSPSALSVTSTSSPMNTPHLQKDLLVLVADRRQRMQVSSFIGNSHGVKIVRLEVQLAPCATAPKERPSTQSITHHMHSLTLPACPMSNPSPSSSMLSKTAHHGAECTS